MRISCSFPLSTELQGAGKKWLPVPKLLLKAPAVYMLALSSRTPLPWGWLSITHPLHKQLGWGHDHSLWASTAIFAFLALQGEEEKCKTQLKWFTFGNFAEFSISFSVRLKFSVAFDIFSIVFDSSGSFFIYFFLKTYAFIFFYFFLLIFEVYKNCVPLFSSIAMKARISLFFRHSYDSSSWGFVKQPDTAITHSNAELADCKLSWQGPSALSVLHKEQKNPLTLVELSILGKSSCT